jgi:archaellum component FlaC
MDHTSTKNFRAIREGFGDWNKRINEMAEKIDRLEQTVAQLTNEIAASKQLISVISSQNIGPTQR